MKDRIIEELKKLEQAVCAATNAKYFRFESLTRELERVGFPYTLVQTYEKNVRGNLYYWTASWGKGEIYIQETIAGRKPVRGVLNAINAIKNVLESYTK